MLHSPLLVRDIGKKLPGGFPRSIDVASDSSIVLQAAVTNLLALTQAVKPIA